MPLTHLCFSPHNHQCVLLNGRRDGPFGKWKMENGKKGRVSSVPSSPLLLLYKGDLRPYFRLFRCYFFITLKKIKNKNFTFYFLSTTSFFDDFRATFCDPLSSASPSCCKFINFSSFRLVLSLYFSS